MVKTIKSILIGLLAVPILITGISLFSPAVTQVSAACEDGFTMSDGGDCVKIDGFPTDLKSVLKNIVSTALFVLGALSVLMIIYGGFRYVLSGGNATSVAAAKNTILYAIVGVVVALLSYAIVQFVISTLTTTPV